MAVQNCSIISIQENLFTFLNEVSQVLNADQILAGDGSHLMNADSNSAVVQRYGRTTAFHTIQPAAILFPETTEQVAEIAKVAHRNYIPLHPISAGKNWGYGDACAPSPDQVIVDLKRMNRILEVNTELGYVVIEPGVTQGQLWQYLQKNRIPLWTDATGAGPDTSIIGNIAERGFGHTRYSDHFQNSCGMEVVLADGRILNTGYGHYEGARAKYTYRYGVGPMVDGLFTQSNMGIITRVGLWLMPEPEAFSAFFFAGENEQDLERFVDLLGSLRRHGVIQTAVHIANDLRTVSGKMSYPWERAMGITPLPRDLRKQLRQELGIGAWNGCGSISGSKAVVAAIQKEIKVALKGYRPIFLDQNKLKLARKLAQVFHCLGIARSFTSKVEVVTPIFDMLRGIPVSEPLRGASWRVRPNLDQPVSLDPLDQNAGLVWVSPIVPMTGKNARDIANLLEPIYGKHGFEFLATFTLLTDRSLCCVTNISFDRKNEADLRAAQACYDELVRSMVAEGFFPYRTGPSGFSKLKEGSKVFWDVTESIKSALDPHQILSPGRYVPR